MDNLIKEYYDKANLMPMLLEQKLGKFRKHQEIAEEFVYWITNNNYKQSNCINISGYTAEKISTLSPYLIGEASFLLLIELRENPEKAMQQIKKGFAIK